MTLLCQYYINCVGTNRNALDERVIVEKKTVMRDDDVTRDFICGSRSLAIQYILLQVDSELEMHTSWAVIYYSGARYYQLSITRIVA